VDQIRVDGLKASLVRHRDGSTNFDDLLGKEESGPVKFDVDGVRLTDASLDLVDETHSRHIVVRNLNARTGRLANNVQSPMDVAFTLQVDQPKMDAGIKAEGKILFDLEARHYAASELDARVTGETAGIKDLALALNGNLDVKPTEHFLVADGLSLTLTGQHASGKLDVKLDATQVSLTQDRVSAGKISLLAKLDQPSGQTQVTLIIPTLQGNAQFFSAQSFELELDAGQGETQVKAKLTSPLEGNLEKQTLNLPKVIANVDAHHPRMPNGKLKISLNGQARADLAQQNAALDFSAKLDESTISGKTGLEHFSPPRYTFDIHIDQLDADRCLPAHSGEDKSRESPLDLAALQDLNMSGTLRIGSLKLANLKSTNVKVDMKANNSRLDVGPVSADFYQGFLGGALSLTAASPPKVSLRQNLKGVNIGPLLKDLAGHERLEGKGNVTMDVSAQGATTAAMRKALNGSVGLNLTDGALKGINIASVIRGAKAKLGALQGEQVQNSQETEKTDFAELKADFVIRNGIAQNDNLTMKSPLLRMGGKGTIDLAQDMLDYLAKVTVVATTKGQGGKELAELSGVTIPLRISGPIASPQYRLDFSAMASEAVKQKVEEKKEELKGKVEETLKEKLKGFLK
jgi:AsmA protein